MKGRRFRQAEVHETGIEEPSAIAFIAPQVGFLVFADDSSAVWRVERPGPNQPKTNNHPLRPDDGAFEDVESATYDPQTGTVRLVSEASRRVYESRVARHAHGRVSLGEPRRLGRLKRVQRHDNSGYEGFTTLPSQLSPDGTKWDVAVNERAPRRLCFFDPSSLKYGGYAKLPKDAKPLFPDLSSVAIAEDGALFLLSDEGSCFGQFVLKRAGKRSKAGFKLRLVRQTPIVATNLPLGNASRLQPEGMTFDERGDLWIVTEGGGLLIHFVLDASQ